jgi:hypothetical protein
VDTVTFEGVDSKTKLTVYAKYQNIEDLESMIASGMESGAVEAQESLADLVAGMT